MLDFILFILACVIATIMYTAILTIKNESIRIRELLENINKIEIARYKKDFNIQEKVNQTDTSAAEEPKTE